MEVKNCLSFYGHNVLLVPNKENTSLFYPHTLKKQSLKDAIKPFLKHLRERLLIL